MIRPEDFLAHAKRLAELNAADPAEVDLRRTVSAAYYALFHALTEAGSARNATADSYLNNQIRRAYNHGTMRRVCEVYSRSQTRSFPPPYDSIVPEQIDSRLFEVAASFVELQEARNRADYDLLTPVSVRDADHVLTVAARAVRSLRSIEGLRETNGFLTALLLADRWARRG